MILITRIGLNIDTFKGPNHINIPKRNIPDTTAGLMRRDTANTHAHPQPNLHILHHHIARAIHIGARLGHHNIIKVLYG
jgi:hypothetical protein